MDTLEHAMQCAISGNAVLFIGAGFSVGAKNVADEHFLAGGDLSKKLCRDLEIGESDDLKNVSNLYIKKKDPESLVSILKKLYTAKEYTEFQKDILLLPWQRIYTTNYDNIIEKIYGDKGVEYSSVTLKDDPRDHSRANRLILHINGSISSLTKEQLFSDFKLTSTSYFTADFVESDWNSYFVQDVHSAGAIFFVGYSLYDIDIARILFPEKELKRKTHFITSKRHDAIAESTISDFGHYHPIGAKDFASHIKCFASKHNPTAVSGHPPLYNFVLTKKSDYTVKEYRDSYFNDLVQFGRSRPYFVFKSLAERGFYYYLDRSALGKAIKAIEGGITNIIFHSDLGNGKTMTIEGLKCLLSLKKYEIYEATDFNNKIYEDIENVIKRGDKVVFIFDGYIPYIKAIKSIELKRHSDVVLVLSARSVAHEIFIDKLASVLQSPFVEFDLNFLNNSEVSAFGELLRQYGFLTTSQNKTFDIIVRRYKRHIVDIIMDRIGSDHICKINN